MATSFKDHSTTEIEQTIGKALGELFGWPVNVNIKKVAHRIDAGPIPFTPTSWIADLELTVSEVCVDDDSDMPF